MIDLTIREQVVSTARDWCVGEDELQFIVDNYRVGKDKQIGEKALVDTYDYTSYQRKQGRPSPQQAQIQKSPQRGLYEHDCGRHPTIEGEVGKMYFDKTLNLSKYPLKFIFYLLKTAISSK